MCSKSKFSRTAFLTRSNATIFHGHANADQLNCLRQFSLIYLMNNRVFGVHTPAAWLAYVLATTYHETAATMQPIEEYGHGKGHEYGKPDPTTGQTYYGRGYVQLTWLRNYQKAQDTVFDFNQLTRGGVPFVTNADLALKPVNAAQIAINGMVHGWFTGKRLADYLTADKTDYVNARRIINGTDKAELIAGYAQQFEAAINLAEGREITRQTVRNGSQGGDVRELQLMLELTPDGIAGNKTVDAVKQFQQQHALNPDGICGPATWQALDRVIYGI